MQLIEAETHIINRVEVNADISVYLMPDLYYETGQSNVSSTGQWSLPNISEWMLAPERVGARRSETRK